MKTSFKNKARKQFRDKMIEYFAGHYEFYEVTPKGISIEKFVENYFKLLNGRIYKPIQMDIGSLVLAIKKQSDKSILNVIKNDCQINGYDIITNK